MELPEITMAEVAFGLPLEMYPRMKDIPEEHHSFYAPGAKVAESLFYNGGNLAHHGLKLKAGVDPKKFHDVLQAALGSFAPKHEHKMAACSWLIAEHTEPMGEDDDT